MEGEAGRRAGRGWAWCGSTQTWVRIALINRRKCLQCGIHDVVLRHVKDSVQGIKPICSIYNSSCIVYCVYTGENPWGNYSIRAVQIKLSCDRLNFMVVWDFVAAPKNKLYIYIFFKEQLGNALNIHNLYSWMSKCMSSHSYLNVTTLNMWCLLGSTLGKMFIWFIFTIQ